MRFIFYVLVLGFILVSQSCKDGDATNNAPTTSATTPPLTSTTPAGGIEHYTCPNGHAGKGGASAGTCSECGATLEHNAAYHNSEPQPDLANQTNNTNPTPATNSGVEHYICPNGHAGKGGAAAGSCSECGATLEHNAAFHNTSPPADLTNQVNNIEPTPQTATSAPTGGVEHYICPNGHVGSGGAGEGTCSQCQAALVHNDAFHNTPANAGTGVPTAASSEQIIPQPSGAISPVFQNVGTAGAPTVGGGAPGLEPAQNSRGVWHYVCPDGHAGGAGSEQACSQCGKTLIHNTVYHQ